MDTAGPPPPGAEPARVRAAMARAEASGFTLSCHPTVGRLLAALAASVPPGGRILEIGTGAGVGLAWIVHGVGHRDDVEVVSVEIDAATHALASQERWPSWVRLACGDVLTMFAGLGLFDMVFADAQGGKWTRLEDTIAALRPGGMLVVDDLDPPAQWREQLLPVMERVRSSLLGHPDLVGVELTEATGVIIATRRRGGRPPARRAAGIMAARGPAARTAATRSGSPSPSPDSAPT